MRGQRRQARKAYVVEPCVLRDNASEFAKTTAWIDLGKPGSLPTEPVLRPAGKSGIAESGGVPERSIWPRRPLAEKPIGAVDELV